MLAGPGGVPEVFFYKRTRGGLGWGVVLLPEKALILRHFFSNFKALKVFFWGAQGAKGDPGIKPTFF